MNFRSSFALLGLLTIPLAAIGQESVPIERYGVSRTDDFAITIELGGDGARGGNQILLLVQMNNGTTRKFDLNRTREEWPGNSTRRIDVTVQPPILYADVARIGIEWHGSHGDVFQEQDDVDVRRLTIRSRAAGSTTAIFNGNRVDVASMENLRLENDQTYWHGGIRPMVWNPGLCRADTDCSDGDFCNGAERCDPSNPGASSNGCVVGPAPCRAGQLCNEQADRCETSCQDNDGDGHLAAFCGGDDCDDNDSNRYPGNVEIFDAADHDEDCDVNTHGFYRGASSSQICDGRNSVVLVDAREQFTRARCVTGTVCVQQPNGEGVCMVEPPGYQAPTGAVLPAGPQQAPAAAGGSTRSAIVLPGTRLISETPLAPLVKPEDLQKKKPE